MKKIISTFFATFFLVFLLASCKRLPNNKEETSSEGVSHTSTIVTTAVTTTQTETSIIASTIPYTQVDPANPYLNREEKYTFASDAPSHVRKNETILFEEVPIYQQSLLGAEASWFSAMRLEKAGIGEIKEIDHIETLENGFFVHVLDVNQTKYILVLDQYGYLNYVSQGDDVTKVIWMPIY